MPEWLFDECYDAVGDLAETIAHLLPVTDATSSLPLNRWVTERLLPLATQREEEQREVVLASWRELHGTARFVWNKLMTGALPGRRVAATGGARAGEVQRRGRGDAGPPAERPVDAVGGVVHRAGRRRTRATPTGRGRIRSTWRTRSRARSRRWGIRRSGKLEWKWDGIRAQLIRRDGRTWIWSRGGELVTERFPELAAAGDALPDGTVIDGEIMPWKGGPLPFAQLQKRIGRSSWGRRSLATCRWC